MTKHDETTGDARALQALVRRQQERLDALEREVAELRTGPRPDAATGDAEPSEMRRDVVTDRRSMLRHAGVLAAGAVAGGTALAVASASPAAAAPGSFTGAPAVTANGTGGDGLVATTDTNGDSGVYGYVSQKDSHGVFGRNTSGLPGTGMGVGADASGAGNALVSTSADGIAVAAAAFGTGQAVNAQSHGNSTITMQARAYGTASIGLNSVGSTDTGGTGVLAVSGGLGIDANGGTFGVLATGGKADLRLVAVGTPPPTRSDSHVAGELTCDVNYHVWLCVLGGTPGTWVRLGGDATPSTTAAGSLTMLQSPIRCYDSRGGYPPAAGGGPKGPLAGGTQRTIDTTNNASGVPLGATAVLVNLTVTNTSPAGFLALYSNGLASWPGTSSINWDHPGQSIANLSVVSVDANAKLKAYANTATDFLIDVLGYYR